MSGLVVVCGLAAEAKIARGADDIAVIAGGGDAARILRDLDEGAPTHVLSFGVAGGLAPQLVPGDARIASAIVTSDGRRLAADPDWSTAIADALGLPLAVMAGVAAPITGLSSKAALHATTGADLVDMESHIVADWAARHGAKLAAIRVVTDAANRALPHAASVGMRADGGVDLPAILKSLAKNPGQFPGLIRTGLEARAAFATLLRCRQRLGPGFALLDLG